MDHLPACEKCGGDRWAGHAHACKPQLQTFATLREANSTRQKLWNATRGGASNGALYAGVELAGELGELLNVIKKLEREARGLPGSRASRAQLREEIGDVAICLDLLASEFGEDVETCAALKFNKTSETLGFTTRLFVRPPTEPK